MDSNPEEQYIKPYHDNELDETDIATMLRIREERNSVHRQWHRKTYVKHPRIRNKKKD